MLKYLIALADELDRHGEFRAANALDELIIHAMIEVEDWEESGHGNWFLNYKNYRIVITQTFSEPPKYAASIVKIIGWRSEGGEIVPVIPNLFEADRVYLKPLDSLEEAKKEVIKVVDSLPDNKPAVMASRVWSLKC